MSVLPSFAIRLHGGMDSRDCAAYAKNAEQYGFKTVWFAENPFQRGVLPAATACVLATNTIQVGIGVFNPFNRHPTLMAMEIGALNELSGGRALLGIGAGVPETINKFASFRRIEPAMRDTLSIVCPLPKGEEVNYSGEIFSAIDVSLGYPLLKPEVKVFVAAMGKKMLRLCGEMGDGLLISNMCPPAFTEFAIGIIGEGAEKMKRPAPKEVVKYVPCVVDADRVAARRAVKEPIGSMLGGYWKAYQNAPAALSAIGADNGIDPQEFLQALERLGNDEAAVDVLDEKFVRAYSVAGTVDQCLQQCAELAETGVTEMTLTFHGSNPHTSMADFGAAASNYFDV